MMMDLHLNVTSQKPKYILYTYIIIYLYYIHIIIEYIYINIQYISGNDIKIAEILRVYLDWIGLRAIPQGLPHYLLIVFSEILFHSG